MGTFRRLLLGWRGWLAVALTPPMIIFIVVTSKVLRGRSNYEEQVWLNVDGDVVLDPSQIPISWKCTNHNPAPLRSDNGTLPIGIGDVFVSSAPANTHRQEILAANLHRHGIRRFQIRHGWSVERVQREMRSLTWIFRGAADVRDADAMVPRHSPAGNDFEWESGNTAHTWVPQDKSTLRSLANLAQHHEFFSEIVERRLATALILEDDATFAPCFKERFEAQLAELAAADFDGILFVGTCMHRHAPRQFYSTRPVQVSKQIWRMPLHRCANGYVISLSAAEAILSAGKRGERVPYGYRNIDPALEGYLYSRFRHFYWSEPVLVYESSKAINAPESEGSYRPEFGGVGWSAFVDWLSRNIDRVSQHQPWGFVLVLLVVAVGYGCVCRIALVSRRVRDKRGF